ncbi:MAG: hypothetical protein JKY41_15510 [Rhodobacteraceae bacterium]|nr:hypothetical protein [Paracoccaceae bacterium]
MLAKSTVMPISKISALGQVANRSVALSIAFHMTVEGERSHGKTITAWIRRDINFHAVISAM